VAAIAPDGRLVAVLDETRSTARAKVVFATSGPGA
jgi:tRNA pseudouridine55 synthase